jgi:hypothetical protein
MKHMEAADFADVAGVVSIFVDAAARGDLATCDRVLDPVWHGKFQGAVGGPVSAFAKAEAHARARESGAPTSVQVFFGDFAVVRCDDWRAGRASMFLLFKNNGAWRIAGEAGVAAGERRTEKPFDPRTTEREVLDVLDVYYRAVEAGDSAPLRDIFHAQWHMKNHEGGKVVAEDRAAFIRRIDAGPTRRYNRDRHVADVQIVFDSLAYVRIDKPSTPGVTVFLLFKTDGAWSIVDKAWSMARA